MSQADKAHAFKQMHVKGKPVLLYNIWNTGSAKAVESAGAKALATSSWAVAEAHGYRDGESIPFDLVEANVKAIADATDLPLTVDIEGGYGTDSDTLIHHITRIIKAGAIGVNFEDQVVGEGSLYTLEEQVRRIEAVHKAGESAGVPIVINARTDIFIQEKDKARHKDHLSEAKERAAAYREAGAASYFIPFLNDKDLIAEICSAVALPVNAMMMDGAPDVKTLTACGVGRISFGALPYATAMAQLEKGAREAFSLSV